VQENVILAELPENLRNELVFFRAAPILEKVRDF
jgi:hypothetical protein